MHTTRSIFLAAALIICTGTSYADDKGGILGQLKDASGKPISNATVSIGNKSDFTDIDGQYRIKDLPTGNYKVRAQKGAIQTETTVEIKEGLVQKDLSLK